MDNYQNTIYKPTVRINPGLKILLVLLLPVGIGVATYFIFEVLASAYTSEAQLQVNVPLWLADEEEEGKKPARQNPMAHRVGMVQKEILGEIPLTLLSFEMVRIDIRAIWDQEDEFAGDTQYLRVIYDTLSRRLEDLDPRLGLTEVDQSVREWIMSRHYKPDELKTRFAITPIPNTALIRIEGQAPDSRKSGLMVNALADVYIGYRQAEEEKELSHLLDVSHHQMADLKQLIKDKEQFIAEKKHSIAEAVDDELWELRKRIKRLERTRTREYEYIEKLQDQLEKYPERSASDVVPVIQTADQEGISNAPASALRERLDQAQSRMSVIDKQLRMLEDKFAQKEDGLLAPHMEELAKWKADFANLELQHQRLQKALNVVDSLLVLMVKSKTRTPSPHTSLILSLQVGLATLLLWGIFLYQLGYIHLFDHSKNSTGHSQQATIH
ncbi:MAG: hypothetical protein AAFP89_22350 [Bacteroidota bacterium]